MQKKLTQILTSAIFILYVVLSQAAFADLHWQNNSLTLGHGNDFTVNPKDQTTLTIEHASGWGIGDLFMFIDATKYHSNHQNIGFYGELSPRLSYAKLTDRPVQQGPITDYLLATSFEFDKEEVKSFLIGPAIDLNLPSFDYFKLNVFKRFSLNSSKGEVIQITPAWSITTEFANSDLIFDGYIDWNLQDDDHYHKNFHFNPQIKYDLSKRLGFGKKKLLLGVEYSYWQNKYGIKDTTYFKTNQQVTSIIVKSHF